MLSGPSGKARDTSHLPSTPFVLAHRPKTAKADMANHDGPEKRRKVTQSPPPTSSRTGHGKGHSKSKSRSKSKREIRPVDEPPPPPPDMSGIQEETASLTNSAKAHSYENGLRYHGYRPGSYSFPNDDAQQETDHCAHVLSLNVCGRYFQSPVESRLEKGAQVLDLGTGIGIWCEQLADTYPNSSFEGIDLSPIQSVEVPPNVQFYVDDMEHEHGWDFEGRKFDFIFLRNTLNSVRNRHELLKRAYDHLKPGGYFEIQEFDCAAGCDDGSVPDGTDYAFRAWLEYLAAGMAARGSDLFGIRTVAAEMRAAGFKSVTEESRKCPVGEWPADRHRRFCGSLLSHCILTGLQGLSARPFAALGWTPTEIEMFLVTVREHVKTTDFHAYLSYKTVYGRKPR